MGRCRNALKKSGQFEGIRVVKVKGEEISRNALKKSGQFEKIIENFKNKNESRNALKKSGQFEFYRLLYVPTPDQKVAMPLRNRDSSRDPCKSLI